MVRTPVQTNHMCDCPNRLHIDVVGTAMMALQQAGMLPQMMGMMGMSGVAAGGMVGHHQHQQQDQTQQQHQLQQQQHQPPSSDGLN
jgi:hypothetical protein